MQIITIHLSTKRKHKFFNSHIVNFALFSFFYTTFYTGTLIALVLDSFAKSDKTNENAKRESKE